MRIPDPPFGRGAAPQAARVVAITSGKGGVGKTTAAINLAVCCSARGRRVLLLDADMGLANVDVMLDLRPARNLSHVLAGECDLAAVLVPGPGGIDVVPGASGILRMAELGAAERTGLIHAFSELAGDYDLLVVDTPAGIAGGVVDFCAASQEILVAMCDEPASLADAYAVIKVLAQHAGRTRHRILVNQARSESAGRHLFERLLAVACGYLGVQLELAGIVPRDEAVMRAVRARRAVVEAAPASPAALAFKKLAERADNWPAPRSASGGIEFFVEQLVRPVIEEARA